MDPFTTQNPDFDEDAKRSLLELSTRSGAPLQHIVGEAKALSSESCTRSPTDRLALLPAIQMVTLDLVGIEKMSNSSSNGALKRGPFPEWIRETRKPSLMPPSGSCDCQFHIYGDAANYPPKRQPLYEPPNATFEDMKGVLSILGIDRGVIVYPMPYDTDNTLLVDVLRSLDEQDRARFRAVCIVKDEVSDQEILNLKKSRGRRRPFQHRQTMDGGCKSGISPTKS